MGKRVPDNEIEDSIQREKKQKRSEEFGICFELLKWALVVSLPYKQVNRDGACEREVHVSFFFSTLKDLQLLITACSETVCEQSKREFFFFFCKSLQLIFS